MSREIKFRAWDKRNERMIDAHACAVNFKHYIVDNTLLFVPMQYTGLKDRIGKEIYEGDLINEPEEYGSTLYPWKVIWEDNAFFGLEGYDYEAQLEWDKFEVIGNIYENPELLKESKK